MARFNHEVKKKPKRLGIMKKLVILGGAGFIATSLYFANRQTYPFEDWKGGITYAEARDGTSSRQEFLDELLKKIEMPGLEKIIYTQQYDHLMGELERRGYTQQQIATITETSKGDSFTTVRHGTTGKVIVFAGTPAFEKEDRIYFDLAFRHELNHVTDFHKGIDMGKIRLNDKALEEYKEGKFRPQVAHWILELRAHHNDLLFIKDYNLKKKLDPEWYSGRIKQYNLHRIWLEAFRKREDLSKAEEYMIDYHLKTLNEKF